MPAALTISKSERAEPLTALKEQFEDLHQQHEADALGMWIFLATELLFFGGLFLTYTVYRWNYSAAFDEASNHLNIALGTINTFILLTSSFTMAMAVRCSQLGRRRLLVLFLLVTALLGAAFIGVKLFEWRQEAAERLVPGRSFVFPGPHGKAAMLFFWHYFGMTALHAVHLTIGIFIVLILTVMASRGAFTQEHHAAVDVVGLYWHYVDIVWLFLYPLLYLAGRHLQ